MLLLSFPSARWATVLSYRYYVITAILDSRIIYVHSPGTSMAGSFIAGRSILVELLKKPARICSHVVLAMLLDGIVLGANPSLGNLIFEALVDKKILNYQIIKNEPSYKHGRFDFLVQNDHLVQYIEVKSCFFRYKNYCIFPLVHLKDLLRLEEKSKSYQPMSPRAIKHLTHISELEGAVYFIGQRNDCNEFIINPRETLLAQALSKVKEKYFISTHWKDQELFFDNIKRI